MISLRSIFWHSLLLGILAALLLAARPFSRAEPFIATMEIEAGVAGRAQLLCDRGTGFHGYNGDTVELHPGRQNVEFILPEGDVRALRLLPLDHTEEVEVGGVRSAVEIWSPDGKELADFPAHHFQPTSEKLSLKQTNDGARWLSQPGEGVLLLPPQPLALRRAELPFDLPLVIGQSILFTCAAVLVLLILLLSPRVYNLCGALVTQLRALRCKTEAHPRTTLFLAALLATALSCWPVIFCGKSFVSPNNGASLLYDDSPTLPGTPHEGREDPRGADMGAVMWAHLPYSVIEHRAIFHDHELPLWNRYNYCGTPLLGQGMSMLGDPLHWLTICANGAPWAWDAKFVLAKLLFAFAIGLCVRAIAAPLWIALLLTLSSSFLGFFAYRFNHPAFFAMCYAPWILLCWLRARTAPRVWPWALGLAAVCFFEINTGVMKESSMLVTGLNFTGALLFLLSETSAQERLRRLAVMAWGGVLFVLLSAPMWIVFLDTLARAWTPYHQAAAHQIPPQLALGIFDDLFYRQFTPNELHYNPSTNFLILLGCLYAAVNGRSLWHNRSARALLLGALPPAAIAFGLVPASLIVRVPFLGNIQHVDNTFSCVLIVHLLLLAAFGLRAAWESKQPVREHIQVGGMLIAMLAVFFIATQVGHHTGRGLLENSAAISLSRFFPAYAAALVAAILTLPWLARRMRQRIPLTAALLTAACLFLLHFRHAMWGATKFDYYTMTPHTRCDLVARSAAISAIHSDTAEPSRTAGIGLTLVPGYNAVLGLENFCGADALISPWQRELAEATLREPLWGWRWALDPRDSPRIQRFGDFWGIRHYLAAPDGRQTQNLRQTHTADLDLYTSATAWPRAFFTNEVRNCAGVGAFTHLLESGDGLPFAAAAGATNDSSTTHTVTHATGYHLTSNTTSFRINASSAGVVVLGESYEAENWRVSLDDQPSNYFRANHAFLGVKVPPGPHALRFEYWPRVLTPALWLGFTGLALLLLTPAAAYWLRRSKT